MVNTTHTSYQAHDKSYFSILKRAIHLQVSQAGYSSKQLGELDIIVAEFTSNLLKYAKGGEILMALFTEPGNEYVELIAIDDGPGIADPVKMQQDGMSSTNTLGHGLGSMQRLSDFFQLYSMPGWGTVVISRIYKHGTVQENRLMDIRSLVVAKPGETISGDGWMYKLSGNIIKLIELDGLGHGPEANKAVTEAFRAFKLCPYNDPVEIIRFLHDPMKRTRGAVGTIVIYDGTTEKWKIAGVGNITTKMITPISMRPVMSYNGIIGHNIPNSMKAQELSADDFKQVILFSDGMKSAVDISKYVMIRKYDLSVLAACIYKDYARKTDDMSVVIAKIK